MTITLLAPGATSEFNVDLSAGTCLVSDFHLQFHDLSLSQGSVQSTFIYASTKFEE